MTQTKPKTGVYKQHKDKCRLLPQEAASNPIKDVLTSITAFIGITLNSCLGIRKTGAMAGIIIALIMSTMVYPILKEASLVLLHSFHPPKNRQRLLLLK